MALGQQFGNYYYSKVNREHHTRLMPSRVSAIWLQASHPEPKVILKTVIIDCCGTVFICVRNDVWLVIFIYHNDLETERRGPYKHSYRTCRNLSRITRTSSNSIRLQETRWTYECNLCTTLMPPENRLSCSKVSFIETSIYQYISWKEQLHQ